MRVIYLSNAMLLTAITFISCQMSKFNGYQKYQTFNEFELKGVNSSCIQNPYIFLKQEVDTMFVVKSNKKNEILKYINKGYYWYLMTKIEEEPTFEEQFLGKEYKVERLPRICEKFIFKDTIVEYVYLLHDNVQRIGQTIYLKTKDFIIEFVIKEDDIKNYNDPYDELNGLLEDYKNKFYPYYKLSTEYQPRYYRVFEKQVKGDSLFLYEIKDSDKELISEIKYNSLGEYEYPFGLY